ncbi:rRNA processing/ribosome biogenesis-domain-containing protein [Amylocarpus encephaloides]|uniref:Pre-rRNA-processing protein RIX1 n=1 Tax=Amylocarpus encephaloides TaxID=45428 RepID=A0A9P7YKJ6_9HELO|nr:rRNA processing/ribosome biogenesis-domain-containing protein [Amylocarpus encephaloides]
MSLPSELRVLCAHLSATSTTELPYLLPTLLQYVLRCQVPLSSSNPSTTKTDASASAVLVHKLKTQLSTLLNGRSTEGRFAAVVLIKGVVDVGGWEVLRGTESWIRGLLSVLTKTDPVASKELCVVTLTKIYVMTHQYPTLLREITTPTLPTFITSCLNLITSHHKTDLLPSLAETIFRSFTTLLPRHTTLYRPFTSQLRTVTRPYLAPTFSDGLFVPFSLKESARRLVVISHQTAAKNNGGEEWGKAVRESVKAIHVTADHVFRAVVEDWETTAGYIPETINVNDELSGGGFTADDFSPWNGISSGVERLRGLLELLAEYFRYSTSSPVCIPLEALVDLISRLLSIAVPSGSLSGQGNVRLHPAIGRDEKDGLWCGVPEIHVATLELVDSLAGRLQDNFMSFAPIILDQLFWLFPFGKNAPEFRSAAYVTLARILSQVGRSFDRSQVSKLSPAIRACCNDVNPSDSKPARTEEDGRQKPYRNGSANQNADTFLQSKEVIPTMNLENAALVLAAKSLLPRFLSNIPQQHLDISLRSLIERTAILVHHKKAMVASIVNPFVGKNGKAMASVLPHLSREFSDDDVVEVLLRPRMPVIPTSGSRSAQDVPNIESEDEDMELNENLQSIPEVQEQRSDLFAQPAICEQTGLGPRIQRTPANNSFAFQSDATTHSPVVESSSVTIERTTTIKTVTGSTMTPKFDDDIIMDGGDGSSDEESVHLTMQLDTDSESE